MVADANAARRDEDHNAALYTKSRTPDAPSIVVRLQDVNAPAGQNCGWSDKTVGATHSSAVERVDVAVGQTVRSGRTVTVMFTWVVTRPVPSVISTSAVTSTGSPAATSALAVAKADGSTVPTAVTVSWAGAR